jgi:ABC-type bacteriocin/lantibiotic exporter with double-glycine peptidase domain
LIITFGVWYNETGEFMNIIRALLLTIIGVFILMTLWPLFVFLVIVFGLYWIAISLRIRRMGQTIQQEYKEPTSSEKKDVIDAQYTERSE